MIKDDTQMQFAVEHAQDFENMLNSPGWKALCAAAASDVMNRKSDALEADTICEVKYIKGYTDGVLWLMQWPAYMVESARMSEDAPDERLQTRRQVSVGGV